MVYLHALAGHPHVVHLQEVICSDNGRDAVLVLDYSPTDLRLSIAAGRLLPQHRSSQRLGFYVRCLRMVETGVSGLSRGCDGGVFWIRHGTRARYFPIRVWKSAILSEPET